MYMYTAYMYIHIHVYIKSTCTHRLLYMYMYMCVDTLYVVSWTVPDTLQYLEAICIPLVMKMAFRTDRVWPSNVLMQLQSLTAHSFMVMSPEAVSTH